MGTYELRLERLSMPAKNQATPPAPPFFVIILAGLSGAGKTSALNVFEDMRFFVLDGLPLDLVPAMLPLLRGISPDGWRGIVIGVDPRRPHAENELRKLPGALRAKDGKLRLIFVDADTGVIMRRYAATRRPHPLEAEGLSLEKAVLAERARLAPLKDQADMVLDTGGWSIHDLRRHVLQYVDMLGEGHRRLKTHLISFGFKHGPPVEPDMIFDLRFLPNPYFVEELRPLSGLDLPIADYVLRRGAGLEFMRRLLDFLLYLLPLFETEGRYRLSIAFGCTGGRHRSVACAEAVGQALKDAGFSVSLDHRHLELE